MSEYFWQGGKKIPISPSANQITIQAKSEEVAGDLASDSGVQVRNLEKVSEGVVAAEVAERDSSMKKLRENAIVHHVYHAPEEPASEYLIDDTFYVKFKAGTSQRTIRHYLDDEGLELVTDMGGGVLLVRVTNTTGRNCIKASNSAAARDDVEFSEPNLIHRLQRFAFIPPDALFTKQWHLHAPNDAQELVAGAGVFAPEAWDITRGVRDVTICVADDGFDMSHPDFQGTDKVAGTINVKAVGSANLSFDTDVTPRAGDYHGTPCAGVAVAEQNGTGVVGVAPGCSFLAVRFPLNISDAQLAKMFERISLNADVVSCSWGYGPTNAPMSTVLNNTLTRLAASGGKRGKGLVICVAAGNNNCPVKDLQNSQTYEYLGGGVRRTYSGPIDRWIAAHPDVLTVSAATSLKTRSCYSSWGEDIDVCAPTDNWDDMGRFTPKGLGIWTTDNEGFGSSSDFSPGSRFTGDFGGTSSATPTVAGVCGLVISRNSSLTAEEVRKIIRSTADKDMVATSETAVNKPGDFQNGFSLWFGHGKVNAAKAVAAAVTSTQEELLVDIASAPNLDIPDNSSFVQDSITVPDEGVIRELRIGVEIKHTYIGDLRVDIMAPDGTAVTLHNQTGGSQNDLVTTFGVATVPGLSAFQGKSVQGTWKLRVSDNWRMDVGTVKSWRLVCKAVPAPTPASNGSLARRIRTRRRPVA